MKILFYSICTLLLLSLVACSPTVFTHPTKNAEDFEHDKYDCKIIAEQSAANWGSKGNPFMISDEINQCLQHKFGWTPVGASSKSSSAMNEPDHSDHINEHFNSMLNKNFRYIRSYDFHRESIVEIKENKTYGEMRITSTGVACIIKDRPCNNKEQWQAYVNEVMEQ